MGCCMNQPASSVALALPSLARQLRMLLQQHDVRLRRVVVTAPDTRSGAFLLQELPGRLGLSHVPAWLMVSMHAGPPHISRIEVDG